MRTGRARDCSTAGRVLALAVAGLAACGVLQMLGSTAASAQDPAAGAREVPIGTFTLGSPPVGSPHDGFSVVEPPAGVPERRRDSGDDGSGRWFFQGWESAPSRETAAESLYQNATAALEGGRRDEAQRLFEQLIAEAPNSPRAGAARQHLGRIYRAGAEAAAPAASDTGALPWVAEADARSKPAEPGVALQPSRAALHQARVSPALDGEFLSDAGDRVFFSAGSVDLGARARGVIQSQARFLKRYPELYVAVEGFADDGSMPDTEMQRLSDERATAVRDRLIAEGVEDERVLAYGRGREDRVSDCAAPECLAQNRRAVTILLTRRVEAETRPARRVQGASGSSNVPSTQ